MEKRRLRIVSYNIHKGFNSGNRKFTLRKIRAALEKVRPDVVFLQEVLGQHDVHSKKVSDWPDQPQFEYLAHELWPHYTYGRNAVYTSGHHGNAILSKYPFIHYENIDISTNLLERRGLLHGIIQLPWKIPGRSDLLHAICVHLGLFESERLMQVKKICSRIESYVPHGEPLLICGDFNDWRRKASHPLRSALNVEEVFLNLHGTHARTFPSWLPALRLDRIYYRGLVAKTGHCMVGRPWNRLSDHVALLADVQLE